MFRRSFLESIGNSMKSNVKVGECMKKNYHTKEQVAMKLELEGYRGNLELETLYMKLLDSYNDINYEYIKNDLRRVRGNINFLRNRLERLPKRERDFLYDVYFNPINLAEIMKKYDLKRSTYHRYLDKVIYAFAQLKEL